jgi:hypothetical protein
VPPRKLQFSLTIPAWLDRLIASASGLTGRIRRHPGFCRIPLTQGKFALVDPDDYYWLSNYKWHAVKKGKRFYASRFETRNGKRLHIYMHRQIMQHVIASDRSRRSVAKTEAKQSENAVRTTQYAVRNELPGNLFVDHIDRDPLNNSKSNLRLATRTQNNWNSDRGKNWGSSKYKGVSWKPQKRKWQAVFYLDNRSISLGYFIDEIAAAKAYDRAAIRCRGKWAVLNFPDNRKI